MSENAGGGIGIKVLILFGGVILLLMLGSIAGTLYFTGFFSGGNASGGHAQAPVEIDYSSLPPIYLPIDTDFVVNAIDEDRTHFIQVKVTLMARNQAALDAVTENVFAIRNDIREVISGRSFNEAIGAERIERLRSEAEESVKKYLGDHHRPLIDALYFTAFTVQ